LNEPATLTKSSRLFQIVGAATPKAPMLLQSSFFRPTLCGEIRKTELAWRAYSVLACRLTRWVSPISNQVTCVVASTHVRSCVHVGLWVCFPEFDATNYLCKVVLQLCSPCIRFLCYRSFSGAALTKLTVTILRLVILELAVRPGIMASTINSRMN